MVGKQIFQFQINERVSCYLADWWWLGSWSKSGLRAGECQMAEGHSLYTPLLAVIFQWVGRSHSSSSMILVQIGHFLLLRSLSLPGTTYWWSYYIMLYINFTSKKKIEAHHDFLFLAFLSGQQEILSHKTLLKIKKLLTIEWRVYPRYL